jgi:citryl-CoA lyase
LASWGTGITDIRDGAILIRGYPIERLIGSVPFAEALFLLLAGDLPPAPAARVMDAVLVAALDHGTTSPSALAARTVVSGGAPVQVAAAAGILALNKYHGAAVEGAARLLKRVADADGGLEAAAAREVARLLESGERVPGFGHRVHELDPRVERLFSVAAECGSSDRHIQAARAVERALATAKGRHFPMNLDTAIAAVLLPYLDPGQILGVFVVSRLCGIYAQADEEARRMKPMRRIEPSAWVYDGPPPRGDAR